MRVSMPFSEANLTKLSTAIYSRHPPYGVSLGVRMSRIIDTVVVDREVLSPDEFLRKIEKERSAIKSSRIVAPKLGRPGFGGVEVEYNYPIFRPAFDCKL